MQNGEIPERFDPRQMARESAELHGQLPAAGMERLRSAVIGIADRVALEATFGSDEAGHPLITGSAEVTVTLRCQRCLGPVEQQLHAPFRLAVVVSEADAQRLPDDLDAVIVEGRSIETAALVEDELILALPLVGRHERLEDCGVDRRHLAPGSGGTASQPEESTGPFAALEALKRHDED
jgi:uncharacterized protein